MKKGALLVFALCLLSGTGCGNMKQEKELLAQAQALIEERKYPQAIGLLSEIADNEDAAKLLEQLYYVISGDYIENLGVGAAAIDREGHVRLMAHPVYFENLYAGREETLKTVGEWENIRRLSDGEVGLDALDKDGGFYTVRGASGYDDFTERNRRIAELEPLQVLCSYIYDFTALRMDGTICAYAKFSDYLEPDPVKQHMARWTDIKDIVSGPDMAAVLLGDGTVDFVCGNCTSSYDDMLEWTDIVAIDGLGVAGCIAGLKSDGTVVVSNHGVDQNGAIYRDAFEWSDIIAISKGFESLLGLKRDGTVVAAGNLRSGQENIAEWTDIVAISAGQDIHVGLKRDGSIVIAGDFGGILELPDMTSMKNLYVPDVTVDNIDESVAAQP
ncbi:MAG: hypothetical protein K2J60_16840 [Acetatifactor sp.]|nr:hypothetical protein [Acetatifactor sp.]